MSWLDDFVNYTKDGETPEKIMFWVGVSTIAGALRRKVWIEEKGFQWTPNFYILIVAPPNTIHKSTSIGLGMKLLEEIPDIDFGPQSITWQQLVTHMANSTVMVDIGGKMFEHSSCTIQLSEFGSFFDPSDRSMVDTLTSLWDGELITIRKETKTNGNDVIVNPWVNMIACTTPKWMSKNFSGDLVSQGLGSRFIYLHADKPKSYIAYPSQVGASREDMFVEKSKLISGLMDIADMSGEFRLTKEAYKYGDEWYANYKKQQEKLGDTIEAGYRDRWQTHLHKIAIVLAASNRTNVIDVALLQEADRRLLELESDAKNIFGFVGQSPSAKLSKDILDAISKVGIINQKKLFRNSFFHTTSKKDFIEAMESVIASGLAQKVGDINDPSVKIVKA